MSSTDYKNTDLLKFLPFYTSEIQKINKKKTANKKKKSPKNLRYRIKNYHKHFLLIQKRLKNLKNDRFYEIFFQFLKI